MIYKRYFEIIAQLKNQRMSSIIYFIIIILAVVLHSCSDPNFRDETQNEVSENDSRIKQSNDQSLAASSLSPEFDSQISEVVRTVFQDSRGIIWFGTQNGAFRLNEDSLTHINNIKSESGKGVTIKDIAEDKDGKIWFGHTDGISSLGGELVTNYYESDGLISNDVWCMATDSIGKIWIGTIDGTCVFNGNEFTNFELPEGKIDSSLGISSTKMVHSIMEDRKGTLWFSSNAGLFSYSDNVLINVSEKLGIPTNFVNEIFEDSKGEFWISTKEDLYHLKDNTLRNITKGKIEVGKGIGSIAEDEGGNIWFVANQHYLYIYNRENLIEYQKSEENKGPVIFKIYKDQDDRLWFVGCGGAYRLENGKFLNITKNGFW
jgi:ligand-binding sensor domain-containing protein